jgi:pantothenate synthetase
VDPDELTPVGRATGDAVCALAAHVGTTRLIDNAPLGGASTLDGAPTREGPTA